MKQQDWFKSLLKNLYWNQVFGGNVSHTEVLSWNANISFESYPKHIRLQQQMTILTGNLWIRSKVKMEVIRNKTLFGCMFQTYLWNNCYALSPQQYGEQSLHSTWWCINVWIYCNFPMLNWEALQSWVCNFGSQSEPTPSVLTGP